MIKMPILILIFYSSSVIVDTMLVGYLKSAIGSRAKQKWCPNVPSKWLLVVLLPAQAGSDAIGTKQLHTSIAYKNL